MTNKLARKVAIITGGSTGMGLATAKRFIQEGMDRVFITGRRKDANVKGLFFTCRRGFRS